METHNDDTKVKIPKPKAKAKKINAEKENTETEKTEIEKEKTEGENTEGETEKTEGEKTEGETEKTETEKTETETKRKNKNKTEMEKMICKNPQCQSILLNGTTTQGGKNIAICQDCKKTTTFTGVIALYSNEENLDKLPDYMNNYKYDDSVVDGIVQHNGKYYKLEK